MFNMPLGLKPFDMYFNDDLVFLGCVALQTEIGEKGQKVKDSFYFSPLCF